MPTYQYACTECGDTFEEHQSFTDDALTECPTCGGRLRKVFNGVGIIFKGSGFYRTDSREAAKKDADKNANKDAKKDDKKKDGAAAAQAKDSSSAKDGSSGKDKKADSKPAASTPSTSGGSSSSGSSSRPGSAA